MKNTNATTVSHRVSTAPPPARPRFQGRALTSVVVTLSFVMLALSGVMLWAAPPGRIANWTDWRLLALRKSEWIDLHIWFGLVFLIAAVIHLVLNWRPLLSYFKDRISRQFGWRREWLTGLALSGLIFFGVRYQAPPFSSLLGLTEDFRSRWEKAEERPPIPHAELLTLRELAERAGVDLDAALARLEENGIRSAQPDIRMAELAKRNQRPARQIYDVMLPAETRNGSAAAPRQSGAGGGAGQKTLAQFCADEGLDLARALSRLEAKGIKASPTATLRDIALSNGYQKPYELLEILRER